jgi:hypothetical protein
MTWRATQNDTGSGFVILGRIEGRLGGQERVFFSRKYPPALKPSACRLALRLYTLPGARQTVRQGIGFSEAMREVY